MNKHIARAGLYLAGLMMLGAIGSAAAQTMTVVSGDNQTVSRVNSVSGIAKADFAPLTVSLKDAAGKPVAGATVTWTCNKASAAMACQSEPSGASPTTTTTDGSGNSTLNKMGGKSISAYYADGKFSMTASAGNAKATFNLTVGVNPAAPPAASNVLKIVSGDKQSVQRGGSDIPGGRANFAPLVVEVTDPAGKPISGAKLSFLCGQGKPQGMACQLAPAGGSSALGTTGADGKATLNQMGGNSATAYYASGKMPIVVSGDNMNQVTFDLTVLDMPPPPAPTAGAVMTLVSGDKQTAPRVNSSSGIAKADFGPLTVSVKDAAGKPLSGVQVTWSCAKPAAMACQSEPSGASPTITTTDGNGNSTLNKMGGKSVTAYYGDGNVTITASYGAAKVNFTLTIGGAAPASNVLKIVSGDKQEVARAGSDIPGGRANFAPLVVQATDPTGKPIGGLRLSFLCGQGKPQGMACQLVPAGGSSALATTGADGKATLNQMGGNSATAYYATGKMPIVVSGDNVNQVTFDLTVK